MKNIFAKIKNWLPALLTTVFVLLPLTVYVVNFKDYSLSPKTEEWGQFGDFLNGVSAPLIALAGVLVSLQIARISDKRNESNAQVEQLKQRPLLHIGYRDFEERLRIYMVNKGNGPLLIENFRLIHESNEDLTMDSMYRVIKMSGIKWFDNYTGNQNGVVLSPDEEIELLLFQEEGKDDFSAELVTLRRILAAYKIVVDYRDVYNIKMPQYQRSLAWFGRHQL